MDNCKLKYELIVTIVNKGFAEEVVEASKKAGAKGGTIMHGRGSGIHENVKILGIPIEPEKDIVLTLIDSAKTSEVLEEIYRAVQLGKPGNGLAFVLDVEKVTGICHMEDSASS